MDGTTYKRAARKMAGFLDDPARPELESWAWPTNPEEALYRLQQIIFAREILMRYPGHEREVEVLTNFLRDLDAGLAELQKSEG